jgi:hypothetical protein
MYYTDLVPLQTIVSFVGALCKCLLLTLCPYEFSSGGLVPNQNFSDGLITLHRSFDWLASYTLLVIGLFLSEISCGELPPFQMIL